MQKKGKNRHFNIAVLPGDGIGPEITKEAIKVLEKAGEKFGFSLKMKEGLIGAAGIRKKNNPCPPETIHTCRTSDAILLGAVGDPEFDNNPSAPVRPEQGLLRIRKELGLFANIRPVRTYTSLLKQSPLKDHIAAGTDFIVYRELTGGIYFGEKGTSEDGSVSFDRSEYSRDEILNISRLAFSAAEKRNKKLTLVDKANVLETSRLWRKVVMEESTRHPLVDVNYLYVDNAAMQIILNPSSFDVVLTENMFGDILTDEASVIAGSIGILPSASVGFDNALFEPIHGSYPQAAGKNLANPMATILSVAMMLDHLNLPEAGECIRNAVDAALKNGKATADINRKNPLSTTAVGDYIRSVM